MAGFRTTRDEETINASARGTDSRLALRIVLGDRVLSHALPEKGEVVLGRGHDVDVFIDHRSVSRSHARLRVDGSSLVLEDLGSANGTRVAGRALAPETAAPVAAGDAIELGDVLVVVQRGLESRRARARAPDEPLELGQSAAMREVERVVDRIARGMITVLLTGETGAGKEVVAEAIHRKSRGASKPFVRLNCAAVAESLLESEWFGHERGAFTGAQAAKPGLLETADGGTVLLDEVGELPIALQAKLLRVLEERSLLRVGGVRPRRIDVRFLAATHRDLEAEVARGAFRQDLYFRLNGMAIRIPPLRERRDEIAPLARAFAAEASEQAGRDAPPALQREALALLEAYAWPGNVRELRNVIERAVLLAPGDAISPAELPSHVTAGAPPAATADAGPRPPRGTLREAVADVEKQRMLDALAEAGGNQKRAAELLGISRGTLISRLETFGIPRPRRG